MDINVGRSGGGGGVTNTDTGSKLSGFQSQLHQVIGTLLGQHT